MLTDKRRLDFIGATPHHEFWLVPQGQVVEYLDVCQRAVEDDIAFGAFRANPEYCRILEHAKPREGQDYFKRACDIDEAFVKDNFHIFQENDLFGGAAITQYPFGSISVSSLRYIHLLTEIRARVGPLEDMDIVEIGGGYGGQCRMIMATCKPRSYTLFDLKWPLLLARKWLGKYGLDDGVSFRESCDFDGLGNIDIVISTWAFCEQKKPLRDAYSTHVISKSRRGFITLNTSPHELVGYLQSLNRFEVVVDSTPRALIVQWEIRKEINT